MGFGGDIAIRHESNVSNAIFDAVSEHKGCDRKSRWELISLAQHNSSAMPLARSVLKRVPGSTTILLWYDLRLLGPAAELSASRSTNLWNLLTSSYTDESASLSVQKFTLYPLTCNKKNKNVMRGKIKLQST